MNQLVLRRPGLDDFDAWCAGHLAMGIDGPFDLPPRPKRRLTVAAFSELIEQIDAQRRADRGHVWFGFCDGDWAATVSLFHVTRHELNLAYLGWHVLTPFRRRGLAVEAVGGLIGLAFDEVDLHQLIALCEVDNVPSQRVAERAGMRFECLVPKAVYQRAAWRDVRRYALTEEEHPVHPVSSG